MAAARFALVAALGRLLARRLGSLLVHLALWLRRWRTEFLGRLAVLLLPLHRHFARRLWCTEFGSGSADRFRRHGGRRFALEVTLRPRHLARHLGRVVAPGFPRRARLILPSADGRHFPAPGPFIGLAGRCRVRLRLKGPAKHVAAPFRLSSAFIRRATRTGITLDVTRFRASSVRAWRRHCRLAHGRRFRLRLRGPAEGVAACFRRWPALVGRGWALSVGQRQDATVGRGFVAGRRARLVAPAAVR